MMEFQMKMKYNLDSIRCQVMQQRITDGDGVNNIDEIEPGTNPQDSNDHPEIEITKEEKTLFIIIINRNIQLNKKESKQII